MVETTGAAVPAPKREQNPGLGIVLMLIGVIFLCANDAFAKVLGDTYSPIQILFLRNLIALPIAIVIALKMGGPKALVSRRPLAHMARGVIWILAAFLFFTSLTLMGLAEATVLIFASPMLICALTALLLKEHVGWRRWSAVAVGFIGVLIVVRPGTSAFQLVALMPLATAFLYAVLMLSARWVDEGESVWTLTLYLVGAGLLISAFLVPFVWVPIDWADLWLFVGIATVGTIGITLLTQAFRIAPSPVVAPLDYTALIWATLFGYVFWDEIPDLMTYVGGAVITASGCYIIYREWRLGKTPA